MKKKLLFFVQNPLNADAIVASNAIALFSKYYLPGSDIYLASGFCLHTNGC